MAEPALSSPPCLTAPLPATLPYPSTHSCDARELLTDRGEARSLLPRVSQDDDPDDVELWRIPPEDVHICHALYLGGECTKTKALTVPASAPWPLIGPPATK